MANPANSPDPLCPRCPACCLITSPRHAPIANSYPAGRLPAHSLTPPLSLSAAPTITTTTTTTTDRQQPAVHLRGFLFRRHDSTKQQTLIREPQARPDRCGAHKPTYSCTRTPPFEKGRKLGSRPDLPRVTVPPSSCYVERPLPTPLCSSPPSRRVTGQVRAFCHGRSALPSQNSMWS